MLYCTGMKSFDVRDSGGKRTIHAKATTRAGLAVAALQGMTSIAGGRTSELDEQIERPFAIEGATFNELLAALLDDASKHTAAHGEGYDDIMFTLITEKKATGSFVGRPTKGAKAPGKSSVAGDVVRNEAGEWEAVVSFA